MTNLKQIELQKKKNQIIWALMNDLPLDELLSLFGINLLSKYHVKKKDGLHHVRRRLLIFFSIRVSKGFALEADAYEKMLEIVEFENYLQDAIE